MTDDDRPYEVGYGKPPENSKFAKGKSGNPKGRPSGSMNLASIFLKESRQPVRINSPRGPRTVTKAQAAVMQLTNKAAQGDARAQREYFSQAWRSEEAVSLMGSSNAPHESDRKVMESMLARMRTSVASTSLQKDVGSEDSK